MLSIPSNLNQFLNAGYMKAAAAGDRVRGGRKLADKVEEMAGRILKASSYKATATRIAEAASGIDPIGVLEAAMQDPYILSGTPTAVSRSHNLAAA